MLSSILSRKIDSSWKKRAVVTGFFVLIAVIISQCYMQYNVVRSLNRLNATNVEEVKLAGRVFDDPASVRQITDALNGTTIYSFGNEGCVPPYRMEIVLKDGEQMIYAIGKSRKNSTVLIQAIEGDLPSCLFGVVASSHALIGVLSNEGIKLLN